MQVHPTRASADLALSGILLMLVGLVIQSGSIVAWGGALVIGLSIARAATQLGVSRARTAGLEMLWRSDSKRLRVARGAELEVEAELRNRSSTSVYFHDLRAVCAPELDVAVTPQAAEVPAGARLRVSLRVRGARVGRHGIHGLSLELEAGPSLFEVPLTFANPLGVEVAPAAELGLASSARGGRSRQRANEGLAGQRAGEGEALRELREHHAGDPFRRIAWKASARRGTLLVREYEQEERDVVWLVLDAAVDLWAGPLGDAALDYAIDQLATVLVRRVRRGDRVGLAVVGTRNLCFERPGRGLAHARQLLTKLIDSTGCMDADRSGLDEVELGLRVIEHMRPLDPALAARVHGSELDRIARRADKLTRTAPFDPPPVQAPSARERSLRRYLLAYGVGSPGRIDPERGRVDFEIVRTLERIRKERQRASLLYLFSEPLDEALRPTLVRGLAERPRRGVSWKWVTMVPSLGPRRGEPKAEVTRDALGLRLKLALERSDRSLRKLGFRSEHPLPTRRENDGEPDDGKVEGGSPLEA